MLRHAVPIHYRFLWNTQCMLYTATFKSQSFISVLWGGGKDVSYRLAQMDTVKQTDCSLFRGHYHRSLPLQLSQMFTRGLRPVQDRDSWHLHVSHCCIIYQRPGDIIDLFVISAFLRPELSVHFSRVLSEEAEGVGLATLSPRDWLRKTHPRHIEDLPELIVLQPCAWRLPFPVGCQPVISLFTLAHLTTGCLTHKQQGSLSLPLPFPFSPLFSTLPHSLPSHSRAESV